MRKSPHPFRTGLIDSISFLTHNGFIVVSPLVVPPPRNVRQAFSRAEPFGHAVIDGFLGPDLFRSVLEEISGIKPRPWAGGYDGRLLERDIRRLGPACADLDTFLRSAPLIAWVKAAAAETDLIRNPDGGCGGLFRDGHGQELEPHLDVNCTVAGRRRRATLILYLNPEWRAEWGGLLELFADPARPARRTILASPNRAVLLDSNSRSWHGISPIRLPPAARAAGRRALIVNFYGPGTAPRRFNTWMPRPATAQLRAGRILTAEDVAAVRRLHGRRLELLRELRVLELSVEPDARPAPSLDLPAGLVPGRALGAADARECLRALAALDGELRRLYRVEHSYRLRLERLKERPR
jgi:hypothetical protein